MHFPRSGGGRLFVALALFLLLPAPAALAHVESDMPGPEAEMEYRIYLDLRPNDLDTRARLGLVLCRLNRLAEADAELAKVLRQAPAHFLALEGMGLVKAGRGEYEAAADYLKKAAAVKPEDVLVHYYLAQALEKQGRRREAAEAYRTALARYEATHAGAADDGKQEGGQTITAASLRAALRQVETP